MPQIPNKKNLNGGFVGILMLLVGVAVVIFLLAKGVTGLLEDATHTNTSDRNLAPIDAARNAKNLIEQDNARAIEQLE